MLLYHSKFNLAERLTENALPDQLCAAVCAAVMASSIEYFMARLEHFRKGGVWKANTVLVL